MEKNNRGIERRSLIFVTIVLCLTFFTLRKNQQPIFEQINENYQNKTTVNLDKNMDPQVLAKLLVEGNYIDDDSSAVFIANHLKAKVAQIGTLPNLGILNRRTFRIPVAEIDSLNEKYEYLKARADISRQQLGVSDELPNIDSVATNEKFDLDNSILTVKVQRFNPSANFILRKLDKNIVSVPSVLVQLTEHFYNDSLGAVDVAILGYAKTNQKGIATFSGLNAEGSYSVIPIREGFEYGNRRGTTGGSLGIAKAFTFTQRQHAIQPFDISTYLNLRNDIALTVRTPHKYQSSLVSNLLFILLAVWCLHFYLCFRNKKSDQLILPLITTLSGICLLIMCAIHRPLTDMYRGGEMASAILFGIIAIVVLTEVNIVTFFNSNYKLLGKWGGRRVIYFDFVRQLMIWFSGLFGKAVKKWVSKLPDGSGYLVLALTLTILLFPFGTGPEGSGVKVNLLFFQPGEIVQIFIIVFLSAFFYRNADKIQAFSQKFTKTGFRIQFRTVLITFLALGFLLIMYLALGDMGPALVIAITFIIIYSVVRHDLPQLVIGGGSFIGFLFIAKWLVPGSQLVMFTFAVLWFALWLLYGFVIHRQKQLFESAIFFNLVIAAFIFGENLPNVGERLQDRNDIYANVWNNEVRGGDQVAQGLWGLASGGLFGQGLGEGNPNVIPAFHTDMVFTSIGEEMGWLGLLLVTLCLAILLHRSLIVGQRNGHPFAFYLATGIAVVTGVQFLVITLGSVGIIPLTGVAVPFLSYGKVSMIMNFIAFGIVLSISNSRATENQKDQLKRYDLMIKTSKVAYAGFAIILLATLFYYQFEFFGLTGRDKTLIRPALMANSQGNRIVEYNPRIQILMRQLDAGNIYDRNGVLLATNNKEEIRNHLPKYIDAGIRPTTERELKQRKRRYYPFGEHLFFWLGDFNQHRMIWNYEENNPYGYLAERRHLAALRGFDNLKYDKNGNVKMIRLNAEAYKESPFLPANPKEDIIFTDYDYSFLIPFLKAGKNSRKVERFNNRREKQRDITLTVDAVLQTKMQNEIAAYVAQNFRGRPWSKLRVSVVVLNAKNGELLSSANYPLVDMQTMREKQARNIHIYSDSRNDAYTDRDLGLTYQTQPGSTAKVMSALAGLQGMGKNAASETFFIHEQERVGTEPINRRLSMRDAIVESSNVYFINLINKNNLYINLDSIYQSVGIRIDTRDISRQTGRSINRALTPYFFTPNLDEIRRAEYRNVITTAGNKAKIKYDNYVQKRIDSIGYYERMSDGRLGWLQEHAWAWGQGTMRATPLNMARITGIVANDGVLVETQFVKDGNKMLKTPKRPNTAQIINAGDVRILKGYMQEESAKHKLFPSEMGGKTGTAEREISYRRTIINPRTGKTSTVTVYADVDVTRRDGKMNDGWYMFFIDSPKKKAPLAVAVRMERMGEGSSMHAVRLSDRVVLKVLREMGYL